MSVSTTLQAHQPGGPPVTGPSLPTGLPARLTPPVTNPTDPATTPLQLLSDTLISALQSGPSVSPADNIGPAVITATNASGGTVDLKKIAILAGVALGAWFLWKKYGKKAAS